MIRLVREEVESPLLDKNEPLLVVSTIKHDPTINESVRTGKGIVDRGEEDKYW